MPNRKKRLKKGIESVQKQIEQHKAKRENALEEGKLELAEYYSGEIAGLEKTEKAKEEKLEKSQMLSSRASAGEKGLKG